MSSSLVLVYGIEKVTYSTRSCYGEKRKRKLLGSCLLSVLRGLEPRAGA